MTTASIPDTSHTLIFDRTDERGRLVITGTDRASWLQGLLTNDILALRPGTGAYAAWLTPQGRMISDMIVLAHADELLVDVPRESLDDVVKKCELFIIIEDVVVRDASGTLACLSVHGPAAADVLGIEASALPASEHHHISRDIGGVPATVAVSRELGGEGADIYVAPAHRPIAWAAMVSKGAVPSGVAAWEHRRILAGRPRFGIDMGTQTIPPEAGIEARAISTTKGCYVGQEIIVRMRDIGHGRVARHLVGLRATDERQMVVGDRVRRDDRDVGIVTSVTRHPATSASIALATVHRDAVVEGTSLEATDGVRTVPVVVTALPFA